MPAVDWENFPIFPQAPRLQLAANGGVVIVIGQFVG
jgi:hypothetical protein